MKIAYFCPSEGMYGDNQALLRIMPHLVEMGVEPIFLVAMDGDFVSYLKKHNYKYLITNCRMSNMYLAEKPYWNWFKCLFHRIKIYFKDQKCLRKISNQLFNSGIELVHSNSSNSAFGYELAKKLNIKHVWHLREYGLLDSNLQFFPTKKCFINKIAKPWNKCIAITPDIKNYFGGGANISVIYDGVLNESIIHPIIKKKKNYILFVGRLFEKKGICEVITAFHYIYRKHTNIQLLIAGDGNREYLEKLKQMVSSFDFEKRVKFLGYITNPSLLMSEAKVLIVASDFEGFGFITAEAMYNGCPVIGKNTAGTKLQFDNIEKETGLKINTRYNTQEELNQLLNSFLDCSQDNQDEVSIIQSAVYKMYNTHKSADCVWSFYCQI